MRIKALILFFLPFTALCQNPVNSVPEGALVVRINPTTWYQDAAKAELKAPKEKSMHRLLIDISKSPQSYGINTAEPIWMVGDIGSKSNLTILLSVKQEDAFKSAFKSNAGVEQSFHSKNGMSFLSDDELTVMINNGIATLYFGEIRQYYESDYSYHQQRESLLREIHQNDTAEVHYGNDHIQIIEEPTIVEESIEMDIDSDDDVMVEIEVDDVMAVPRANEYESDEELSYSELMRLYQNHPRLVDFDEKWELGRKERKRAFMEQQYLKREDQLIQYMASVNPNAKWRSHLPNSNHDVSVFFQVSGDLLSIGRIYRRYRSRAEENSKLEQYFEETYTLTHVDFKEGEMNVQTISEQSDLFSSDPILLNKKLKRSTRKMMPKDPYMYYTYHTDAEAMVELYMDMLNAMFSESNRRDSKMALAAVQTVYLLLDDDLFDDALEGGGFVAMTGEKEFIRESKKYVYDTTTFGMSYKTVLDTTVIPEYVWVSRLGEDDFIPKLLEIGVDCGAFALDSNTGYFIQPELQRGSMAPFQFYIGIINNHICLSNNPNLLDAYRSGLSRDERISRSRSHLINQTGNSMYLNMDGIADAILSATSDIPSDQGGDEKTKQIEELKELFGEITWKVEQEANRTEGVMVVETKEGTSSLIMFFELLSRL